MAETALSLVVTPIVDHVVELTSSLIKEKILSVLGVKEAIEQLSSNLNSMQATLSDAEERQLEDQHIRDWLAKLKDTAYDAQDILDTFATEITLWGRDHQRRKIPTPISASMFSIKSDAAQKIKELSARLKLISDEKEKFHFNTNVGMSQPHDDRPQTYEFLDAKDVVGREEDKQKIIDMVLSPNSAEEDRVSVIPIIGMGGMGKTTLAQLVYNDERVKDCFDLCMMWVFVSVDFDLTRILRGVIESYSKMSLPGDLSPNPVVSRFRDFLPGKRFLIVLDDVWNDNYKDWEPLIELLKLGEKGSKVLVTSRSASVARVAGTRPPHVLGVLPEKECRSLFEKIAFKKDTNVPKVLTDIGKEIVAKCNGLPLAVKALAGVLRGELNEKKWKTILRSNMWELDDPNILPALKLSYTHLPSHLKQCFTFCSIIPKAYIFNKQELVKLWMAQSFVQQRGQNSAEEMGAEHFDMLLMRSFFQQLKINNRVRYKMHDLIHDLAQSISGTQCCRLEDSKPKSSDQQYQHCRNWRHVSLMCQDVEAQSMEIANNSKKLRTLLLPGDHLRNFGQGLDKLFRSLKYIRVLDLSSSKLLELPGSIKECKLLRYLDLSGTEIKELPDSICRLYNLQTLKLLGCKGLSELPRDLGDLINLCHLEMDDIFWFKCTTLPPNVGNLTGLYDLHAFKVGSKTGYEIGQLKDMAYLTGVLHISNLENAVNAAEAKLDKKERLQKVVLEWTSSKINSQDQAEAESVLKDLQPQSDLKELAISHYVGPTIPPWMTDGQQLRNLVSMSLDHCTKCRILLFDQLHSLRTLRIKQMHELDILQCPSFLLRLEIRNCPRLTELTELLRHLKSLKIKRCGSVKALPVTPSLMYLILVDNVCLEDWREAMVPRISVNDQGQHEIQVAPSFSNVLEMKVVNCNKLSSLPQIFAPQKLEISGCELIVALPTPQFARRLHHLSLERSSDEGLLKAIPASDSLYSIVISKITNIISLPKFPHLPGLKALHIHNCEALESLSEEENSLKSLTSLRLLSIQGCHKLVTLPNEGLPTRLECLSIKSCNNLLSLGNTGSLKSLTLLKNLEIEDCPLVQSFPEEGLPTSLQYLKVKHCPELINRCRKETGPEWTKIMDIPDLDFDFIEESHLIPQQIQRKKKIWYNRLFACGKSQWD